MNTIREELIAEFQAEYGEMPSPSLIRIIERQRVGELDPNSAEAQRIRADIAEREAVTAEALRRWFNTRTDGLPLPMPSVATLAAEVRRERAVQVAV